MSKKKTDKLTPLSLKALDRDGASHGKDADEALFAPVDPDSNSSLASETPLNDASAAPADDVTQDRVEPERAASALEAAWSQPAPPTSKPLKARSNLPGWARSAYWIAVPAAVLWAGAMAAFASGYSNPFGPFEYRPFPIVAFGGLCLLPALFILLAAYAVRQAAKLSLETRRARDLADEIAIPAALAADQVGGVAEAVRREVERAAAAANAAEQQLLSLRRSLSEESDRLIEATGDAERRAQALTEGLARERVEMTGLTGALDVQVQAVTDAIAAQSRLVSDASDLAATQIQEAQAALAARATDLAAAAGEAGEAAQIAADVLADQVEKLERASDAASTSMGEVRATLSGEHARLAALADSLRADQEHIAARIEAQRIQLLDASGEARLSADDLSDAASRGAEELRTLIAAVAQQVGELAAIAEADQAAMSAQAQSNLKLFTGVVAEERAAMETETRAAIEALTAAASDTRNAAIEQTEAARDRVQQLGETAFALGQKADQAFETRIASARAMIEQSASLVEDAGQRSVERIEAGLAATHDALGDLQKLLGDIDAKVAALPEDARARAETVRQAVEQGIGELTAAARKAAEDTQAIDAAFQSRIKHNYEVLSEALRLMGRAAGTADAATKAAPERQSLSAQTPTVAAPKLEPLVNAALPETERSIRLPPETLPPTSNDPPSGGATAETIGLRPRLKLTVEPAAALRRTAPPPAPAAIQPPRPAANAGAGEEWTWKDLLSSIDAPPVDDEVLADRLISEIEALGLDAPALLPLARIDELAAVMQAGDVAGARDVVRSLAPSAVRRLSRRVLTDKVLRAHADRYLERYEHLLADSAKRDRDGFVTATLLGSDPGRAFLLFNAAVGELH